MKKIVVPTDFSTDAKKAYGLASKIAKTAKCEIVLLHILTSHLEFINDISYGGYNPHVVFDDNSLTESEKAEEKLTDLVKLDVFNGVKVSYFISQSYRSDPLKDVLSFLNKREHSLIVMGTSGDDFTGDTNAEVVARKSTIPVLTLAAEMLDFDVNKILVPTDFHTIDLKFVHRVTELANLLGASLEFTYINTPKHFKDTDYIEKQWDRFEKKYRLVNEKFSVFNDHDVELGIVKMLARTDSSMLALSTHGRTGLGHLFKGSYTEDIINNVSIPVYSYNMSNDYYPRSYTTVVETRGFTG